MGNWLYFDGFNGASGDMILGALVDLGLPLRFLREELLKLGLEEFGLECEPVERHGLSGMNFRVRVSGEANGTTSDDRTLAPHSHPHEHPHGHHGHQGHQGDADGSGRSRGFVEIKALIEASSLDTVVRENAVRIFRRLGEAEAKVHGTTLDRVHFHEVGALDSIVDIVGACVGFRFFEVDRFYSAPLALGGGTVEFSHGVWPVPAPATAELMRGFPSRLGGVEAELTTPTGAAIITTLAEPGETPPVGFVERSGFGAGDRELAKIPNMLRLLLGRADPSSTPSPAEEDEERVVLLEASIDNMDPEMLGYFMDLALEEGALDVFYGNLHMKKNRPGVLLSILCGAGDRVRMEELVFRETTTLGVRWTWWSRRTLDRETATVESGFGPVHVKIGRRHGRVVNVWPEFEDLKRVSQASKLPMKELRRKVMAKFEDLNYE